MLVYVFMYVCRSPLMYACVCVYVCVCMYVCMTFKHMHVESIYNMLLGTGYCESLYLSFSRKTNSKSNAVEHLWRTPDPQASNTCPEHVPRTNPPRKPRKQPENHLEKQSSVTTENHDA